MTIRHVPEREAAPPPRRGERVLSPTLPLPPPRDRAELDSFLESLAQVPVDQVDSIKSMFAGFEETEAIAHVFHQSLSERPCGDIGRFMLLLSAIGQLAHPSSLKPLLDVVWAEDAALARYDTDGGAPAKEPASCVFPSSGLVQSRAVEMFAWIAQKREDHALLRIVAEHPSVATRLAAADAFLFAHDDSPAARDRVLQAARPEDRTGVGVPRLVRGQDRDAFEAAVHHRLVDHDAKPPAQAGIRPRRQHDSYEEA
jgi:hypothetical protein